MIQKNIEVNLLLEHKHDYNHNKEKIIWQPFGQYKKVQMQLLWVLINNRGYGIALLYFRLYSIVNF